MLWRATGSPARVRMGVRSERSPIALIAKIASFLVTGESLSVATTSVGQHGAVRRELLEELLSELLRPWGRDRPRSSRSEDRLLGTGLESAAGVGEDRPGAGERLLGLIDGEP